MVTVDKKDDFYFVAAATIDDINYPPRDHPVRIQQFSSGCVISPVDGEPDKTRFVMVMNTDMKMKTVTPFLSEPIQPKLLIETVKNLRRGLDRLDITY